MIRKARTPRHGSGPEEQPMSRTIVRRDFLKCALASAVVIPALRGPDARATGPTPLDPTDSTAQSLGFVPDASKVDASANPSFKSGQHCGVCVQYQGKQSDARAGCSIYPGHSVPSGGWCGAFAQRP
jgi:High potential iron-sulfur protein